MILALTLLGVALPLSQAHAQRTAPPMAVDWSRFIQDLDGDRLDDSLEDIAASRQDQDRGYDLTVRFDHFPSDEELAGLAAWGIEVVYVSKAINAPILEEVPAHRFEELASLPGVLYVEPTQVLHYTLEYAAPTLKARDSSTYSPDTAWDLGYFGAGINIAIMDSGVNDVFLGVGHTSLDDMDDDLMTQDPKFIAGVDCATGVCIPQDPEMGDSAHGTHVAGIAMGTGGSGETSVNRGVAPGARLIDIRVGAATNLNIAGVYAGYDWVIANVDTDWEANGEANDGVHILSQSFGGVGSNGQDALSLAMNQVAEAGVVCVVAAGNSGPGAGTLGAPAVADHAITIANINDKDTVDRDDDSIASSSSRGPRTSDGDSDPYDEMKPDVGAPGTNIQAPLAWSKVMYASMSGTSMATPAVAGVIALILEANPELQPNATIDYEQPLKQILRDTAQDYGGATYPLLSSKYDTAYGWGQVDAWAALMRGLNLKTTSMSNDGLVYSGAKATVTGTLDLTRTPHTEEDDELVYSFHLPRGWAQPSASDVSVSSPYTTSHTSSTSYSGGRWTLEVTVQVKNPPASERTMPVAVSMKATAPSVSSSRSYDFDLDLTMTGIAADPASTSVTVSPGEQADLMVEILPVTPTVPREGQIVDLRTRVTNQGDSEATADLKLTGDSTTLLDQGLNVEASGQKVLVYEWNTTDEVGATQFRAALSNIDPPDNDGSNDEDSLTVRVNGQPLAVVDSNVTEADSGDPILFDGYDSSDERQVDDYRFDLGDGNQTAWDTDAEYEHAYTDAGDYEVRVQVRDDDGWASEWSEPLSIQINGAPIARLQAETTVVRPKEIVDFNASGSSDSEGRVVDYRYDPGDGNLTDWLGDEPYYHHAYDTPGWYQARVQVKDEENQTSKWSQPWVLKVNARPVARLHVTDNSLDKLNVTIVGLDQDVELNATYSTDDDPLLEAYRFDLGDGSDTTAWQSPAIYIHNYSVPDTYMLKVQVRDANGWVSEWSDPWNLTVNQQPEAVLGVNTTLTRPGWAVEFDGSDSYDEGGQIEAYRFDFGDGELSAWQAQATTTHLYAEAGAFAARLQVKDDAGTPSDWTAPRLISVNQRPVALLTADSQQVKQESTVTFDAVASSDDSEVVAYRFWLAGEQPTDWQPSSGLELTFMEPGTYLVRVQVTDDLGWASLWSDPYTLTVVPFHRELSLGGPSQPTYVSPGHKSYLELTLTNLGELNESGGLVTLEGIAGWMIKLDQEEFDLKPQDSLSFQLEVRPSSHAHDLELHTVVIGANPDEPIPGAPVAWGGVLIVLDPLYDLLVQPQATHLAVATGSSQSMDLTLVNTGNRPQQLELYTLDPAGWQLTFNPDRLALDPGQWANVTVQARAPATPALGLQEVELYVQGNETLQRSTLGLIGYQPKLTLAAGSHALNVPRGEAVLVQYLAPEMTESQISLGLEGGELTLSLVNGLYDSPEVAGLDDSVLLFSSADAPGGYFELKNPTAQGYTLILDNRHGEADLEAQLTIFESPLHLRPTAQENDTPAPALGLVLVAIGLGFVGRGRWRGV